MAEQPVNTKDAAAQPFDIRSSTSLALTWRNIYYKVQDKSKKKDAVTKLYPTKTILNDVSGVVNPGELLAIMGPSGCGKTTLLDLLADRLSSGKLEGRVAVNGRPRGSTYKHYAAYVQQEDTLMGVMTVRETFEFVAKLTMEPGTSKEDERKRIEHVIGVRCMLSKVLFLGNHVC